MICGYEYLVRLYHSKILAQLKAITRKRLIGITVLKMSRSQNTTKKHSIINRFANKLPSGVCRASIKCRKKTTVPLWFANFAIIFRCLFKPCCTIFPAC